MRVLRGRLLITTLCLAVSVFMLVGVSHAKKGGSKVKIEVEAELESCGAVAPVTSPCNPAGVPPESDAEGEAEHKKETHNGVVKKNEFKGKVKIPVDPGSQLGIIDEDTAEEADIRMILSRDNGTGFFTDIAECRLAFDEIETENEEDDDEDSEEYAEYKVDVRIRKGAIQAKKGVCDMDPTTATVDLGLPDAQAGDVVTATLVVDPANRALDVDFLQGTFELD